MAQVRITVDMRDAIIERAIAKAHPKKQTDEWQRRVNDAVMAIYRTKVSAADEKKIRTLPRDFFGWKERVEVHLHERVVIDDCRWLRSIMGIYTKALPIPKFLDYSGLYPEKGSELEERCIALVREVGLADVAKDALRRDLEVMLKSCGTLQKLLTTWPEGKKFIDKTWLSPNKVYLPALPIASLNERIFGTAAAAA